MILTVTANPSIDISYKLDVFQLDRVNRTSNVTKTAGGKGLNVTRVLKQLGSEVLPTGFVGGKNGEYIIQELNNKNIKSSFYKTDENTRNCIAILHEKKQTEILEAGGLLTKTQEDEFVEHFKNIIADSKVVTISGSTPPGISEDFYAKLIEIANERKCKVILDSSGDNLSKIVLESSSKPYCIKPNEFEINHIENLNLKTQEEFVEYLKSDIFKSIPLVVMTRGKNGAIVKFENSVYSVEIPNVKAVNPVGSGDSTVAGLAYGIDKNMGIENTIKLAMACGISNAIEEKTGYIDEGNVKEFMKRIKVNSIV
ncbi:MAG: hexose kinase [Lagierella massiliensis]|nr:hexose kinase [Lagierella massiliensis]